MLFVAVKYSVVADWPKMHLKKKNPQMSKLKRENKAALVSYGKNIKVVSFLPTARLTFCKSKNNYLVLPCRWPNKPSIRM